MAAKVLDSYALMAFFEDEPGADFVRGLIHKAMESDTSLLMSVINLGEVWYSIARTNTPDIADQYIHEIKGMGIEIVEVDWALTRQAAAFKVGRNISVHWELAWYIPIFGGRRETNCHLVPHLLPNHGDSQRANISYADCFAAALAKLRKADLVTGDKEFKALDGEIKISWV